MAIDHLVAALEAHGITGADAVTCVKIFRSRLRKLSHEELLALFGSDGARAAVVLRAKSKESN